VDYPKTLEDAHMTEAWEVTFCRSNSDLFRIEVLQEVGNPFHNALSGVFLRGTFNTCLSR